MMELLALGALVGKFVHFRRPLNDEVEFLEARASGLDPEQTRMGAVAYLASVEPFDLVGGPGLRLMFLDNRGSDYIELRTLISELDQFDIRVYADQVHFSRIITAQQNREDNNT